MYRARDPDPRRGLVCLFPDLTGVNTGFPPIPWDIHFGVLGIRGVLVPDEQKVILHRVPVHGRFTPVPLIMTAL